ncbi:hypothetical protein [Moorena sp. SIO3I6]|uniref:hypothetical protein n=2 Tax=unclassified Moorena TaxID=2683338 RepID=UPI0013FA0E32|nr:hypothetical protein [Moorena sp. SIO3I6]NEP27705.1 hypothetical protein [Moorena sp. SIO3I6]
MTNNLTRFSCSRRDLLIAALGGATAATVGSVIPGGMKGVAAQQAKSSVGPVGFTSFINPSAVVGTRNFKMGAASLIDAFVTLKGASAKIGNAVNLQDNTRLLNFRGRSLGRGNLELGDGTFTAHGVTFVGRVRIGQACGTGINAIVQNADIGDASFTGLAAQILGENPRRPIKIPPASLVLFGARIYSQLDVKPNIIPVPAPFSLFFADVDEENLVLARGFNLLYRAAARTIPFSDVAGNPRNPGEDFPNLDQAFGKLSVAPPSIYRRGTGVIPARQATLGDLGFERFEPLTPVPTPSTPADDAGGVGLNAPPSNSPEAGARFVVPVVKSPELIDKDAIVLGGCRLESGVVVGKGSYILGDVAPTVSVGKGTTIGKNSSLHQLTFTSCRVGARCVIGDRVVLHGPLEIEDDVTIGNGTVLFGPTVRKGVKIGARVLVFGPVEVTEDIPDDAIVVAPGNEFLIAPSAPSRSARITLPHSNAMLSQWGRAQAAGCDCGCGVGALVQISTLG